MKRAMRLSLAVALATLGVQLIAPAFANADCYSDCENEYSRWNPMRAACKTKCAAKSAYGAAKSKASSAYSTVKSKASSAYDTVKSKASSAYDSVKSKASSAYSTVKNKASSAYNTVKNKASSAYSTVKNKASSAYNTVKSKASSAYNSVKNKAKRGYSWAKNKAKRGYNWAKNKAKRGYNWTKNKAKRGYDWAKNKAKRGYNWAKNKAKRGYNWAKNKAKRGYNWAKNKAKQGGAYVKKQLQDGWAALKALDCNKLMDAASNLDPVNIVLKQVPGVGACHAELQKGFICKIPNLVKDLGTLLYGSAKAAWQNKGVCGAVGLATLGQGVLACGMYHWMVPKLGKVARCLNAMRKKVGLFNAVKALFTTGESKDPAWLSALKFGCNFVGGIIVDAVIAVLTGGGSIAGTVSGWFAQMAPKLAAKLGAEAMKKVAGGAIALSQQVIRLVDRELPAACR